MNPIENLLRTLARPLAAAATVAAVLIAAAPGRGMSADSSGYSIVLPSLVSTSSAGSTVNSFVFVENHSASAVGLTVYYVGAGSSANPGLLVCSEQRLTTAPQTFRLEVAPDGVLQFDLRALLEQKCLGSAPPGTTGDHGTLTIFTAKAKGLARISAVARVRALGPSGETFGFSEDGLPLGALEGNTQIVAGLSSGPQLRVDCLVSSFYDASSRGDLYQVTVADAGGAVIGSKTVALKPWSSERLVDVFSLVNAAAFSGEARVTITPAANKTRPSLVSSCQVVNLASPASLDVTLHVGKVYRPLDLLRQRRIDTQETPGWGTFTFVPGLRPRLHAVFLRAPDLVACGLGDDKLQIVITTPDGHFVAGGCGSTGEFFTGHRGEVNGGDGGAWGVEVDACASNPPSSPTPYRLSCVSGNGMSQMDRLMP